MQNKDLFIYPLGLPESSDICAELVHKSGVDISILEVLFPPASKSE